MNKLFYFRLALTNLKKNADTYIPYILASVGTMVAFYTMIAFSQNTGLEEMPGAGQLKTIFFLGTAVIGIFSVIFLFYTNSFLIKRRKKEIGLYSVLGMEKKHIGLVLLMETVTVAVISIVMGILSGIILGKLLFLILLKVLNFTTPIIFQIEVPGMLLTLVIFSLIFLATLIYNLIQVQLTNPIELLRGGEQGEKEPKTSWLLTLIGVLTLGGAYTIAITVKNPVDALMLFFVAVVLVIVGTYALFTSGSIFFLRKLKKNKNYYYQPRNFISVSGMIYRMKQNAVGLASICILSTMVLVTISTTVALYAGQESIMKNMYLLDVMLTTTANSEQEALTNQVVKMQENLTGITIKEEKQFKFGVFTAFRNGDIFDKDTLRQEVNDSDYYQKISEFVIMGLDDYNQMSGKEMGLADNEALVFSVDADYPEAKMVFGNKILSVKENLSDFPIVQKKKNFTGENYYLVVRDMETVKEIQSEMNNDETDVLYYGDYFNIDGERENKTAFLQGIQANLEKVYIEGSDFYRQEWYSIFGGFLFLGIFMGTLFLMATVLIIYFKQLSEGYEDRKRFEIMQNVGMDQREVKKTIGKQILIVFFLPLLTAALHTLFAFPVLVKMLLAFNLDNTPLFFICTLVTVIAFALIYGLVYKMTAKVYYRLVKNES